MELRRKIGHLLRGVEAGEHYLVWNHEAMRSARDSIVLQSADFEDGQPMPVHTAGRGVGENISPELHWSGVPRETKQLVLVMEDPCVPLRRPLVHMVVQSMDPSLRSLPAGALSVDGAARFAIRFGRGSFGRIGYAGPRALPGHGPHLYHFQLFACDRKIESSEPLSMRALLASMECSVIARGRLRGSFEQ